MLKLLFFGLTKGRCGFVTSGFPSENHRHKTTLFLCKHLKQTFKIILYLIILSATNLMGIYDISLAYRHIMVLPINLKPQFFKPLLKSSLNEFFSSFLFPTYYYKLCNNRKKLCNTES